MDLRAAFGTTPSALTPLSRVGNSVQWIAPGGLGGFVGQVFVAAREGGKSADGAHKVRAMQLGYEAEMVYVTLATTESENDLTTAGRFKDRLVAVGGKLGGASVTVGLRSFAYGNARQDNTLLAAVVPFGAGQFKASWLRANLSGAVGAVKVGANDAQQWGLGYVHSLSRRTALYGTWSRIDNDGSANFIVPDGAGSIAGRTSTGWEVGMRHNF